MRALFERLNNQPTTFALLNISAYFPHDLWIAKTIQIIVLNLKKVAHVEQDSIALVVNFSIVNASEIESSSDGQAKRVEGCFPFHYRVVLLLSIVGKVT